MREVLFSVSPVGICTTEDAKVWKEEVSIRKRQHGSVKVVYVNNWKRPSPVQVHEDDSSESYARSIEYLITLVEKLTSTTCDMQKKL